jgi:MFS family permease
MYLLGVTFIMAWHTTLPFVAVYARSLGASPPVVGLVVSTTVLLSLLFGVQIGAAVDSLGVRRVARWSATIFVLAYALMATSRGLWALAAALAVAGFADIGLVVASQTYVATQSAAHQRDRNFAYYTVWVSLGALLGPIFGGILADRWGYRAAFAGSMGLALLTLAVTTLLPQRTEPPAGAARQTTPARVAVQLLRQRGLRLVMLVNAAAMFAFSARQSFYPLYYQSVGLGATSIGAIFSLNSLCGMLARPMIEAAVRRVGHVAVLGASLCLTAVGIGITPRVSATWGLALAFGAVGVAMGLMQPLTMSLISGRAPEGAHGIALGLRVSVNQLAMVIGPPAFGLAVAGFGLPAAFYTAASAAMLGLVAVARLARSERG